MNARALASKISRTTVVAFAVGALVALAILRLFPALVGLHTCHDAGVVCLFSEKAY